MQESNFLDKNIWLSLILFPFANIMLFILCFDDSILGNDIIFFGRQCAIYMLVAIAEELFFRGLLLRELVFSYNWQPIRASLIVSVLFGVLHLLNVHSYATWSYALVQSICAFAVSVNICAVFINTKSLLLCIAIHAMINITSIGLECSAVGQQLALSNIESNIFLSVSFIYLISGIKMLNNKMVEGK